MPERPPVSLKAMFLNYGTGATEATSDKDFCAAYSVHVSGHCRNAEHWENFMNQEGLTSCGVQNMGITGLAKNEGSDIGDLYNGQCCQMKSTRTEAPVECMTVKGSASGWDLSTPGKSTCPDGYWINGF